MGIIGWIILGALAGIIAKAILPGDDPGGIIITPLIGIAGALIAGFIAQAIGFGDPIDEFFDWSTWIAPVMVASGVRSSCAAFVTNSRSARSRRSRTETSVMTRMAFFDRPRGGIPAIE